MFQKYKYGTASVKPLRHLHPRWSSPSRCRSSLEKYIVQGAQRIYWLHCNQCTLSGAVYKSSIHVKASEMVHRSTRIKSIQKVKKRSFKETWKRRKAGIVDLENADELSFVVSWWVLILQSQWHFSHCTSWFLPFHCWYTNDSLILLTRDDLKFTNF